MSLTGRTGTGTRDQQTPLIPPRVVWLTIPLTLCYAAAVVPADGPGMTPGLSIAASAVLFILAIGLSVQLAALTADAEILRSALIVESALAVVLVLAAALWRPTAIRPLLAVLVPAAALGLAVRKEWSDSRAFWWSLAALLLILVGFYFPEWPKQVRVIREAAPYIAGDVVGKVQAYGMTVANAEEMIADWTRNIRIAGWLLPGIMTLSSMIPFGIGALWFLSRRAEREARPTPVRRFTEWSLSRAWLIVLVIAFGMHFADWKTLRLVADNVLLALAISFAIVGTSAAEKLLRTLSIPVWGRVVAYVIIAVAHVYGLLLLLAAGVVDTILGFRRRVSPANGGKE